MGAHRRTPLRKVSRARYQTAECRNVAIGQAIDSLGKFIHHLRDREPVLRFVRRQRLNSRPAVRKKAAEFLQRQKSAEPVPSCRMRDF